MQTEGHDYGHLETRLKALDASCVDLAILGHTNGYPIYCILLGAPGPDIRNVLITTGVHGDEPAGPEAVLRFLERDPIDLLNRFAFLILPCINPWGYVHNRRENADGIDINRAFEDDVLESNLVKAVLKDKRFDAYMDVHEDWEATGFYMYEGRSDEQWMGPQIIRNVRKYGPVDTKPDESDIVIAEGIFKADPAWGTRGIVPYTYTYHADHVLIFETPLRWDPEKRVQIHLTALGTVLEQYRF